MDVVKHFPGGLFNVFICRNRAVLLIVRPLKDFLIFEKLCLVLNPYCTDTITIHYHPLPNYFGIFQNTLLRVYSFSLSQNCGTIYKLVNFSFRGVAKNKNGQTNFRPDQPEKRSLLQNSIHRAFGLPLINQTRAPS